VRKIDAATGLVFFVPPVDATGSGIRTLTSDPDGPGPLLAPRPGDVFLFAPSGVINAGEAGISAAGNPFVAALFIANSANISAAGTSTGVPQAAAAVGASLLGSGLTAASAAQVAEEASKLATQAARAIAASEAFRPSVLTVEVLRFGD